MKARTLAAALISIAICVPAWAQEAPANQELSGNVDPEKKAKALLAEIAGQITNVKAQLDDAKGNWNLSVFNCIGLKWRALKRLYAQERLKLRLLQSAVAMKQADATAPLLRSLAASRDKAVQLAKAAAKCKQEPEDDNVEKIFSSEGDIFPYRNVAQPPLASPFL